VDQFRDQYAAGGIVLQLTAPAGPDLAVTRAELLDARFAPGPAWEGSILLPAGQTKSLPTVLAAPRCGAAGGSDAAGSDATGPASVNTGPDPAPTVRATFADGSTRDLPAEDPHGVLARIHAERCFAERVAAAVALRLEDSLGPGPFPGAMALRLAVDPPPGNVAGQQAAAGSGAPVLRSVGTTTLLAEDSRAPWPRDVALTPGGMLAIVVRPARCDPHAVAEDKVGTLIPLTLDVGGRAGVVKVASPPALRGEIYEAVGRICAASAATPAPAPP
jgi:hypothetical protein